MKYKITLKGRTYEVEVERGEAMLLDEYEAAAPVPSAPAAPAPAAAPAAAAPAAVSAGTKVDAPLPGNVLNVKVSVGQAVKAGDDAWLMGGSCAQGFAPVTPQVLADIIGTISYEVLCRIGGLNERVYD